MRMPFFFFFFLRLLERLGKGERWDGLGSWSSEAACQLCDLGNTGFGCLCELALVTGPLCLVLKRVRISPMWAGSEMGKYCRGGGAGTGTSDWEPAVCLWSPTLVRIPTLPLLSSG